MWDQTSNGFIAPSALAIAGAAAAITVFDGGRMYVAFTNANGQTSSSQGYVFVIASGAVDKLFAPPLTSSTVTLTISQPTTGTVTQGTHRLAFIFITRSGYQGTLNPVNGSGTFAPLSFTATDSSHNVQVQFNWVSLPSYLQTPGKVQIAMTTAANLNRYFLVPGTLTAISGGTQNISFDIDDSDLVTNTEVTSSMNLLTQAVNGTGPFNPSSMFTYSSRMAYITQDAANFPVIYFSDVNAYQSITAAFSAVYLEGHQIPIHGQSLGSICYIGTVAALYAVQDNGNQPSTWSQPAKIDGSVGILSPTCMIAVGGRILLASEKGLFIFRGGSFPEIPLSYYQSPDWNRINWTNPMQVQIVDDAFDRVIRVLAPLNVIVTAASNTNPITLTTAILVNGQPQPLPHNFQTGLNVTISGVGGNTAANTTQTITVTGPTTFTIPVAGNGAYTSGGLVQPNAPNAQMCWNYTNGETPDAVMYSLHSFGSYQVGAMGIVRNLSTQQDETWFAPTVTNPNGNLIRRVLPTDTPVHRDIDLTGSASAINGIYETGLLPGSQDDAITIHDYHGAHFRMYGSGNLNVTCNGLDRVISTVPLASPYALSTVPGKEILLKWFLRSEQQSIQLSTNAVDAWFLISLLRSYYSNSLPMR